MIALEPGCFRRAGTLIDRWLLTDRPRIGPLDGMRSLAITLVLLRHCFDRPLACFELPPTLALAMGFGWAGVNLFFTLSGFLIGGQIYDSFKKGYFFFADFYLSRSLRILPAAYVYMAIFGRRMLGLNAKTAGNFLYVANVKPNLLFGAHLWSLCVEEQFYLVFPLMLVVILRVLKTPIAVLRALILIVLAFVLGRAIYIYWANSQEANFWASRQLWSNFDFLILGTVAAIIRRAGLLPARAGRIICLAWFLPVGYLLMSVALWPLNLKNQVFDSLAMGLGMPLLALWCFASVMMASSEDGLVASFLSLPPFRWIAALSYSMYLFHIPLFEKIASVFFFLKSPQGLIGLRLNSLSSSGDLALAAVVAVVSFFSTVIVALIIFSLVERPFLLLRNRALHRG